MHIFKSKLLSLLRCLIIKKSKKTSKGIPLLHSNHLLIQIWQRNDTMQVLLNKLKQVLCCVLLKFGHVKGAEGWPLLLYMFLEESGS